ncbi:hypothetical protein OGH69_03325 [Flavobacterium sp. MFBS3-15]|uniref:hypothetical protein n=1 Tax=Flavobacterium sp. MFBS3-15 TaxID=2989816 RepID=UPI002235D5E8|nr:hypothetical protein [Flavobacterium sp. MFBS3-15]MCW4467985.1 hypothetical protein [Flavobacterium sp. MFBS3-15]
MQLRKVEVRLTDRRQMSDDTGKMIWKFIPATYGTGYFHCWEHYKEGKNKGIFGIVELEDGTLRQCDVDQIRFLDKPTTN